MATTPCQRRKHAKSRYLWVGKRQETTMAEFITSTITRKGLLGWTRETGKEGCVGVAKRNYAERTLMFDCHLRKTQAAICFILKVELSSEQSWSSQTKRMAASLYCHGLGLHNAVCTKTLYVIHKYKCYFYGIYTFLAIRRVKRG